MQFVNFEKGCAPEGLTIAEVDAPVLTDDKVLLQVHAFGVNRADTLQRQGHYPPPPGESEILGLEVAGEVIEVGATVSEWKVGDKVFGLVAGGGYAQQVAVNPHHLMRVPENMAYSTAAGLAEVFLTAFQCLRLISNVKPAERVLIHGGASGVGLAATQLCHYWGVESAVTASSQEKLAQCKQNGANLLINYKDKNFAEEIKASWPEGVNMVLDMVGGDYLNRNLQILKRDGIVVYLAMLAGRYADNLDMALMLGKRARIQGTTLRNRTDEYKSALISDFSTTCLPAFTSGELSVNIDTVYAIDDVAKSHARLEGNDTQGKIVVEW
ncbi:NAD(P)H-quinone oxidoreductase [Alteromonas stellipolaris]|uniref:NAD(P)H-quinone oxidoreductase n=2 Tax=Alteromonas stellipolaris TaxID=233316 RepID=UPI001D9D40D2|nr:NAD(P)H-quinone oxidoreductase [Alteromonas stellipolaris]MBZ2164142.1 NAD(P)H-quinone oxidoreductase [Alteromonas stellipolaris]MDO6535484.1 NAD(P)H-quinone oxidoreductase [Alteromonas stellipolaris]MDO6627360.1 NAD(P)H-quinone oxidoreductase [Alteromonas stellipolaris]